jgi:DNA-binding transcriptional LysR family regulator
LVGARASEIIPIDSLTAQKRMVEAGFGLALLQESSVNEELRAGALHALPIPAMRVTIPVVLIHRRRAYLSGAARALMTILTTWPASAPPARRPARQVGTSGASAPRRRPPARGR